MGGEVLELMDDKIERSRKEGIQEGIALGRQEGASSAARKGSSRPRASSPSRWPPSASTGRSSTG